MSPESGHTLSYDPDLPVNPDPGQVVSLHTCYMSHIEQWLVTYQNLTLYHTDSLVDNNLTESPLGTSWALNLSTHWTHILVSHWALCISHKEPWQQSHIEFYPNHTIDSDPGPT